MSANGMVGPCPAGKRSTGVGTPGLAPIFSKNADAAHAPLISDFCNNIYQKQNFCNKICQSTVWIAKRMLRFCNARASRVRRDASLKVKLCRAPLA